MSSSNITVGVSGMTCGSCVGTVTKAIENLGPGVKATVSLASGTAHVAGSSVTYDAVVAAVEACGFKAGPCGTSSGGGAGAKCSAGAACTCGENCQCGDTCRCADCPGTCGKAADGAPCPAKAKGTCTCGDVCSCGPNCTCAGCPGRKNKLLTKNNVRALAVVGAAVAIGIVLSRRK
mmetsp:Transcript_27753/g.65144  ORF Transcript_27753/g.65144 Transcript_27753/m.65144 type:complete len:177 (+) Transcript_27753:63-593(+)|eukprot:CAMPEP_0185803238 /NCGR_PEP_ID=MMETSP1322-20130828/2508_1 /TAXON_ID=265543 /ORGANISM="Minutocellus polymorphus, Strain RCC2270" /LENGTH=176 /DNA_ID=CAMNT_0028499097 /DNA_START=61 /DNA_END=591 /DNA_ORIENTATION=+